MLHFPEQLVAELLAALLTSRVKHDAEIPAKDRPDRTIHLASRTPRACGWTSIVLGVVIAFGVAVVEVGGEAGGGRAWGLALALAMGILGTWLVLAAARWEITRKSITRIGLRSRHEVEWRDVEEVTFSAFWETFTLRTSKGSRMRIPVNVSRRADLLQALELRLRPGMAQDALRKHAAHLARPGGPVA